MDLLSASQIDTFDGCERKGAWKYIARVEAQQSASAALGSEIDDDQLQPFLRDGRPLDFSRPSGEIAQSIVQYLPPAGSCDIGGVGLVQAHFEMPSPTWIDGKHCGLGLQGYVDLWMPNGGIELPTGTPSLLPNKDGICAPVPTVVDFKSTGDLKWAKTADDLRSDVQAQTYAFWAMYETGSRAVDLVWLYMRTKGARQSKRVHLRVLAQDVAKQFVEINDRALHIHETKRTVKDPLELPPTPEHCEAFGGCPYRDRCNLGPGEIADAAAAKARRRRGEEPMSDATTSFLERMRLKREAAGGAPAAPAAAPAPAPAPVPEPAKTTAAGIPVENIPEQFRPVVGINPPEKELPPAPPVGSEPKPAATRGPGRPPKQLTIPGSEANGGERVKVTWGREKFSPVSYNDFDVGPFEAEGSVRQGETIAQAAERIYAELAAFAEKAREAKAASNAPIVGQIAKGKS